MNTLNFTINLKHHAYTDPGTGSLLIQMLIAILASIMVVIGVYWRKVKNWLKKISGKDTETTETEFKYDDDDV